MNFYKQVSSDEIKKDYCPGTGISAVLDPNVKMKLNEYGEYKPVLDKINKYEKENYNKELLKPFSFLPEDSLNIDEISSELYKSIPGIKYDKRTGYYKDLYAGHVIEGDFRENASSGGFGTWIFKELLEKNLIDGVIHVKQNSDEDREKVLFKYDISKSIAEICAGAKTKYYPVELSHVIKMVKETPGRYAIIGIPSFIMSIRLLAKQDSIINDRIKYTVGLICGHQKSSKFAEYLAWQVGIKPGNLKTIDFRKKLPNSPANSYGIEVTGDNNGKEITIVKPMSELFGNNWGYGFFKSNASDFTDDVMNETADVTLGDAWLHEYSSDTKGNNVILVRNETIAEIIEDGINTGKVKLDQLDVEDIVRSQASHFRHTRDELGYRLLKKDIEGQWRPKNRIEPSDDISFIRKKIQDLREEMFLQSHINYKKAVELNDINHFKRKMNQYVRKYEILYLILSIQKNGPLGIIKKIPNKIIKLTKKVKYSFNS